MLRKLSKYFLSLKSLFLKIFDLIISFPFHIYNFIGYNYNIIKNIITKIHNIGETNINLGLYHLSQGNLQDAIIRFRITGKFFLKNNKKLYYYLGISYLLSHKLNRAVFYLEKSDEIDKYNILSFINNVNLPKEIPNDIYEYLKVFKDKIYQNKIEYLYKSLFDKLFSVYDFSNNKNLNILELSISNGGFLKFFNHNSVNHDIYYKVIGDLGSNSCSKYILDKDNNSKIKSNKNIKLSVRDFLKDIDTQKISEKYDIIISLNGINYKQDISDEIYKIISILEAKGKAAIMFEINQQTKISNDFSSFLYSRKDLEKILNNHKEIKSYKSFEFNKGKYVFFIFEK